MNIGKQGENIFSSDASASFEVLFVKKKLIFDFHP